MKKHRNYQPRVISYPKIYDFAFKSDVWNHIYGLFGLLGLITSAIYTYKAIHDLGVNLEYKTIIVSLCSSLIGVFILFVVASLYYSKKLSTVANMTIENEKLKAENERIIKVSQLQSDCFHCISHYSRNVIAFIEEFLKDPDKHDNNDIKFILDRYDSSLINITATLQNYFSIKTGDSCAVTLKIMNKERHLVKTLFRDPNNFKKRRTSDDLTNGISKIEDNTAFKIITSPEYRNVFFACDNLSTYYDTIAEEDYQNSNKKWKKYYNATIVVPISLLLNNKNQRDIVGFLAIDNNIGNLASDKSNAEFLLGIADTLYNLFVKYSLFINIVKLNSYYDDRIKRLTVWDGSR